MPTALITYFLRAPLASIFSKDSDVIDLFSRNFWLISVGLVNQNLMLTINHGILTAFGEQGYTSMTLTISSLFIGLPIVLVTIFLTDWGMIGILYGWIINDVILLMTGLVKIWKADISNEIEKSHLRVEFSTYGSLDTPEMKIGCENPIFKAETGGNNDKTRTEQRFENGLLSHEYDEDDRKSLDKSVTSDDRENGRDTKTVLKYFLLSAILFTVLACISFIRDYN